MRTAWSDWEKSQPSLRMSVAILQSNGGNGKAIDVDLTGKEPVPYLAKAQLFKPLPFVHSSSTLMKYRGYHNYRPFYVRWILKYQHSQNSSVGFRAAPARGVSIFSRYGSSSASNTVVFQVFESISSLFIGPQLNSTHCCYYLQLPP